MKDFYPDEALGAVIGHRSMPRTQIVKKLWAYIHKHDLQDAKNRRMINADEKLRAVFDGKDQVSMFEMTKLVNEHLSDTPPEGEGWEDVLDEETLLECYELLKCEPDVSDEELQRMYRELCRQYHPDRVASLAPEIAELATEKFQEIQNAYESIKESREV